MDRSILIADRPDETAFVAQRRDEKARHMRTLRGTEIGPGCA